MERMLGEFLAFARGDGLEETVPTDPFALAAGIAEDARRAGTEIRLVPRRRDPARRARCRSAPARSRRAVQNLVGNAAQHGSRVLLTVRLAARAGWPSSSRTTAPASPRPTAPARCSPSPGSTPRAPQTDGGNVGLGLSIALDVARSHGGSLELGQSPDLGGLRATLRLPR